MLYEVFVWLCVYKLAPDVSHACMYVCMYACTMYVLLLFMNTDTDWACVRSVCNVSVHVWSMLLFVFVCERACVYMWERPWGAMSPMLQCFRDLRCQIQTENEYAFPKPGSCNYVCRVCMHVCTVWPFLRCQWRCCSLCPFAIQDIGRWMDTDRVADRIRILAPRQIDRFLHHFFFQISPVRFSYVLLLVIDIFPGEETTVSSAAHAHTTNDWLIYIPRNIKTKKCFGGFSDLVEWISRNDGHWGQSLRHMRTAWGYYVCCICSLIFYRWWCNVCFAARPYCHMQSQLYHRFFNSFVYNTTVREADWVDQALRCIYIYW